MNKATLVDAPHNTGVIFQMDRNSIETTPVFVTKMTKYSKFNFGGGALKSFKQNDINVKTFNSTIIVL